MTSYTRRRVQVMVPLCRSDGGGALWCGLALGSGGCPRQVSWSSLSEQGGCISSTPGQRRDHRFILVGVELVRESVWLWLASV